MSDDDIRNQSTRLNHLVNGKNIFDGGVEQLQKIVSSLGYNSKYPWICEALFGSIDKWKEMYPNEIMSASSKSCSHRKDDRIPEVYAIDLYVNWIMEDCLIWKLTHKFGFDIKLNGIDACRTVCCKGVTNKSDTMIRIANDDFWCPFELSMCYTRKMSIYHCFHFRDKKLEHIIQEKGLVLHIEYGSRTFFLFAPFCDTDMYKAIYKDNTEEFNGKQSNLIQVTNESDILDIGVLSKHLKEKLEKLKNMR